MPKERLVESDNIDFVDLWISRSNKVVNEARKKVLKSIRTTLSPTDINRLFPEPTVTCPHYVPYIATPTMLENFTEQWDPDWRIRRDFSLKPLIDSLYGRLKDAQGESHVDYAELRGSYRLLMIQNLLQSGWRPEKDNYEAKYAQAEKDKDFSLRLKRLVKLTHSNSWSFFSKGGGDEIWKVAQAEVLAHMETTDFPLWTNIFRRSQKGLKGR